MTISSPYGVPYDLKAAGTPPTYLNNIPMTANRQWPPDVHDEAMPYRPRERSMEKAFRQLCCGSCWGFCAWIAGMVFFLTGIIVLAVVLVSNSKHSAPVPVPVSSSTSPAQVSSTTINSPVTSFITTTVSSQEPSISVSISTVSPLQPSTVTDTASQTSTSTVTVTQTSTTTSTVSPPQTQAVTQSLLGSLTTLTTTVVSIASTDSSSTSRLTSLIQTINAPPEARLPLSPPCFASYLNDVAPALYTGQSWTTVGTYEFFSTAGGIPTRDALMTYTGVELGATTTVWPLCGQYTLSTYSVAPAAAPPTTAPTITRTSVIVVTGPTSTVLPLQQQHTLLPTPSHANLAISPRRPATTISGASGAPSNPAFTTPMPDQAVPTPSIPPGPTTRTDKIAHPPSPPLHTTAPAWQTSTSKRDVTARSTPPQPYPPAEGRPLSRTGQPAATATHEPPRQTHDERRDHRGDRAGQSDRGDRGDRGGEPVVQTRVFVAATGLGVGVRDRSEGGVGFLDSLVIQLGWVAWGIKYHGRLMAWAGSGASVWHGERYQSHWIDERASEKTSPSFLESRCFSRTCCVLPHVARMLC